MGKIKIKAVNVNFILMMIVVILLALFAFIIWQFVRVSEAELIELKSSMEDTITQGEIGDVEGYGLIVSGIGYGLGSIGIMIVEVFFVIIPLLIAGYTLLMTVIGRIVYAPTKGRLLAYRILMGFDYVGLAALVCIILSFLSTCDSISSFIKILVLALFLLFILCFNIYNTYSKRIKN